MHWTTHIVTGAALGFITGRPLPALAVGVASHVALDAAPHFDPDHDLGYVLDSAVGLVILAGMARSAALERTDPRHAAVAGAVGGALPDVEHLKKLFVYVEENDYRFPTHNGTIEHRETAMVPSYLSQVGISVGLLGLAWLVARRRAMRPAVSAAPAG